MSSCVEYVLRWHAETIHLWAGLFMCVKASSSETLAHAFFLTQTAAAPVPVWNNICAAFWVCLKRLHGLSAALLFHQLGLNLLLGSVCRLEILGHALEPPPHPPPPPSHTSMTFTGVQGRVVHLQEKTNKHGGRGSASVQTLLIWLLVSMEPQPQRYCWHGLRHVFDMSLCVQHKAVCEECVQL